MPPRIVLIAGPTAVGKSSVALRLAERMGGELVSIDSVQIYRGLDIGSAKPDAAERARAQHHMLDLLDPDEDCNVADFVGLALDAIRDVTSRGKVPIAVGGTNLYVRVLVHGIFDAPPPSEEIREQHRLRAEEVGVPALHDELREIDPELAERVHPNDLVRVSRGLEVFELTGKPLSEHQREHAFKTPNVEALKIALNRPRPELYERIGLRVDQMMEQGFLTEVERLVDAGYGPDLKPLQSLGYRHMCDVLAGTTDLAEAVETLKRDTRRFAKQQLSWLRSEPDVVWADAALDEENLADDVRRFVDGNEISGRWANPDAASY